MENAILVTAIIGFIGATKETFPKVSGLYAVLLSLALGVLAGYFGVLGATLESGLISGLSASGLYVVAKRAGGK